MKGRFVLTLQYSRIRFNTTKREQNASGHNMSANALFSSLVWAVTNHHWTIATRTVQQYNTTTIFTQYAIQQSIMDKAWSNNIFIVILLSQCCVFLFRSVSHGRLYLLFVETVIYKSKCLILTYLFGSRQSNELHFGWRPKTIILNGLCTVFRKSLARHNFLNTYFIRIYFPCKIS